MKQKKRIIKIAGWAFIPAGILTFVFVIPFFHKIENMDNNWFLNRFGPGGDDRNYEHLYETSLVLMKSANRRLLLFEITLGAALLGIGIILIIAGRRTKCQIEHHHSDGRDNN